MVMAAFSNRKHVSIILMISLVSVIITMKYYDFSLSEHVPPVMKDSGRNFFSYIKRQIVKKDHDSHFHLFADYSGTAANIQPEYSGAGRLCGSPTKQMPCSSVNSKNTCIKVTAIGLCGGWATSLRKLPTRLSCPKFKDKDVVLEHVGKPEAISQSDIVLFTFVASYMNMDIWLKLRRYRSPGQMWVMQSEESPYYAIGYLPPWMFRTDTYNISNTYHSNSNIYSPYGYYKPFRNDESNKIMNVSEVINKKSRFMIWISSHCETLQWDRTKFVKDLKKVIDIDIFGKCGNNSICQSRWKKDCTKQVDELIGSYKFYLAIENSCCEDYITEKMWHAYTIGTVPVVIGPRLKNYRKLAPPGSFIHLDQFESAEDLRSYLEYLDKNETAYLEYFTWRTKGTVKEHSMEEHYKNHLSDDVLCSVVDQFLTRKQSPADERTRMFDPYGPEWKGTCHRCAEQQWIHEYEYAVDHKRRSKWLWAR